MKNRNASKRSTFRIALLLSLITILFQPLNAQTMDEKNKNNELSTLSKLNAQFIKNFINQDTVAHNEIIHEDFVCIQSSGIIIGRNEYMKGWANGYSLAGYKTFDYTDEDIRIFGNTALIRSRTVYTKITDGNTLKGSSVYTDTYVQEKGKWWCVQAQITPVK